MKISMRWVLILGSIFLVWGTHLIITPSSYLLSERVLKRHTKDIMENISDLTLEQSFNHLSKAKSAAHLAKQLLSANVVNSEIEGSNALERYFFDQLSIYPHLAGIYFGHPDGSFFYVSRNEKHVKGGYRTKIIRTSANGRQTTLKWRDKDFTLLLEEQDPTDTYDPRTRPWYKQVLLENRIIWTSPYIFYTSRKPGVTIAGPSHDEHGKLKGIVGVDIDIAEISTFLEKLRVGKSGSAFMLNRNGDVIAYPDLENHIVEYNDNTRLRLPKVDEMGNSIMQQAFKAVQWQHDETGNLTLAEPVFASFQVSGKNFLSMFTPFPASRLPWIIGVYIPEDDYLAEIKTNRLFNIIATIVLSIFASWFGLTLARSIIRPIDNLHKETRAMEEMDMKTTFDTSSVFHELQETADSFMRMKTAMIGYKEELLEKELIHRAITSTANDAIIMMDEEHRISYWNPAAARMFGYSRQEVMGRDLHKTLSLSRFGTSYVNTLEKFTKEGRGPLLSRNVEVMTVHKNGAELPVELSLSRLKIKDKWHAVAIIRNISERMKAEQIRKRLVQDLHDGIGGSLTNIKLLAEMAADFEPPPQIGKNLSSIADISEDCITEIRNYMNILDEKEPNWQNLLTELRQYCGRMLEAHNIAFNMSTEVDDKACAPPTLLYMNLFKVVKEAVTNIIKHAAASEVTLDIKIDCESLNCTITDNGRGAEPKTGSGRGLISMETRVKEVGGVFTISSRDGVQISISIPLRQDAAVLSSLTPQG